MSRVDHCEQVHGIVGSHIDLVKRIRLRMRCAHSARAGRTGAATVPEAGDRAPASTTTATSVDPIAVESEPIVTIVRGELLGLDSAIASRFAGNSGKRRRTGALASRPAFRVAASPAGARAGGAGRIALHAWRWNQVAPDPPMLTG
jgi:hypothetical protein